MLRDSMQSRPALEYMGWEDHWRTFKHVLALYSMPRQGHRLCPHVSWHPNLLLPGVDMDFLRAAIGIAGTSVYSLHKTSTRDFIHRFAVKTLGLASGAATVVAQLRYDLPPTYAFHR